MNKKQSGRQEEEINSYREHFNSKRFLLYSGTFASISNSNLVSYRAENLKPLNSLIGNKFAYFEVKSSAFEASGKTSIGFTSAKAKIHPVGFVQKATGLPIAVPLRAHKLIWAKAGRMPTTLLCIVTTIENTLILTWNMNTAEKGLMQINC